MGIPPLLKKVVLEFFFSFQTHVDHPKYDFRK